MTKDGETVLRTRGMRKAFTAVAIAAVAGLALPAQAMADPAAPPAPESVPIEFLASFAPAIIGAAAGPADVAGGPQQALLDQARAILNSPGIPPRSRPPLRRSSPSSTAVVAADRKSRTRTLPSSRSSCTRRSARVASRPPPIRSEPRLLFRARLTCLLPAPLPVRPASSSPLSELLPRSTTSRCR